MKSRLLVAMMGFALGASLVAGVAVATTKASPRVTACVNSKHVLTLASKQGKCAKKSHRVTLDERGPKGARGKPGRRGPAVSGAMSSVAVFTQSAGQITKGAVVDVSGTNLKVQTQCIGGGSTRVFITGKGSYLVQGTARLAATGDTSGQTFFNPTASTTSTQQITVGTSLISFQNDTPITSSTSTIGVDFGTIGGATLSTALLVTDGTVTFTIDASMQVDEDTCSGSAQIIPTS
jgi:hypothetical protein